MNEALSIACQSGKHVTMTNVLLFKKKKRFYLFLERGEGKERGRETSIGGCFPHAPYWGPGPQPRHVPWTGHRTGDPLVCRPVLSPLSYASQGTNVLRWFNRAQRTELPLRPRDGREEEELLQQRQSRKGNS